MNISKNPDQPYALSDLGWNPFFEQHYRTMQTADSLPARVVSASRSSFQVLSRSGELSAEISGKMHYQATEADLYPAVGDWVVLTPLIAEGKGIIQAVLPRKSSFSRKAAGRRTQEQVVAANVDTVFIVSGLDGGRSFNPRRIERYLTLAWSSSAAPVAVLNKLDLCDDVNPFILSVESIAPGIPVHPVSALRQSGLDALKQYLARGSTTAFLGSSGAGKSALINALIGAQVQQTGEVRPDDRMGRHTTTRRELFLLPGGGMVIDTPGMREIQLWAGEDDLQGTFHDIELLAGQCRFSDCSHTSESGCAVKAAIERGELDAARWGSYRKLQDELKYLAAREEYGAHRYEKMKWKKVAKWAKECKQKPWG